MSGFDQGFVLPNRNASGWDSDLNANFGLVNRGYVIPFICGTAAVNTGTLVSLATTVSTIPIGNKYNSFNNGVPEIMALQAASPGNVAYGLMQGGVTDFAAYSGQLTAGSFYGASVVTPGWVTNSFDQAPMFVLGRCLKEGMYTFAPMTRLDSLITQTRSGLAHCASGTLGVFSFAMFAGCAGFNTRVRVRSFSCDNFRLTFFANSGRDTIIYDTVINSGNLGVRTMDMIDAAMWPVSLGNLEYPQYGEIHGKLEVLSSAATAINSQNFQINADFVRVR